MRDRVRQAVAACLVAGLLTNGTLHAFSARSTSPVTAATHHGSHPSPADHRGPLRHHDQCCDLCTVHCASDISLVLVQTPAPQISRATGARVIRGHCVRALPRLRYRLPLSQAPPALLG